jgi:hypothetical protein
MKRVAGHVHHAFRGFPQLSIEPDSFSVTHHPHLFVVCFTIYNPILKKIGPH